MARRAAPREPMTAWLGQEIRLERGRLSFEGSLRIDGTIVDGHLTGPQLVVGAGATVTGRITVENLVVYGNVNARAHVSESAVIAPGGVFAGEMVLERPILMVEEGGRFEGRVRMVGPARRRSSSSASSAST